MDIVKRLRKKDSMIDLEWGFFLRHFVHYLLTCISSILFDVVRQIIALNIFDVPTSDGDL